MTLFTSRRCGAAASIALTFGLCGSAKAQFLFDASKAQMAANADWVLDASTRNLGDDPSTHAIVTGAGNESNPQQIPTPAASGITASTTETYWSGGLSAWGVSLVKSGKSVSTLPYNGAITYGNVSNPQDLSNYKVFVVDEPNISFTAAEKTAIYSFIKAGGGLVAVSDHNSSDRNGDGVDSVDVWNAFLASDGAVTKPLGLAVNVETISPDTTRVATDVGNPITRGSFGNVNHVVFHSGAGMTINTANNASVKGAVFASTPTNSNVLAAYGTYGAGKFFFLGDSSPTEDGTGDPNDTLFDGWTEADHANLLMNASLWAATPVPEPATGIVAITLTVLTVASRRRAQR